MVKRRKNHIELNKTNLPTLLVLAILSVSFCLPSTSYAEEPGKAIKFPSKPVRIIVPAAVGGALGREVMSITPFLEKSLGVKTPIDYVPGGDGIIAYNRFYQEKPDGYTISYFSISSAIPLELTRETAKFSVKNFSPIAAWNIKTYVLLVHPDSWKTFSEFLNEAKKRNVSMAGTGGATETQYRLMERALRIKFNYVNFDSSAEGSAAVAGRHVDTLLTFTISSLPMIRAGKLRALAVFSPNPDPSLPGAPNLKELGHDEVPLLMNYGMFAAPPNTPNEIIAILEKAVRNATADSEFNKLSENIGTTVDFKPSSELKKIILEFYELLNKQGLSTK